MGQEAPDINAQVNAGKSGWYQNLLAAWDEANKTGEVIAKMCPAKGSLYRMADETLVPVENLKAHQLLAGIDGESQEVEEIQSAYVDVIRVQTENGFVARNSLTHAYALPRGGFTVAARSLGKTILTETGPSRVISVDLDGKDWVFNVITNGSHTYCADGIWALGVGEAERHVGMNEWAKIGSEMIHEVGANG